MASKPAVRGQRPNMSRDTSKAGQRVQSGGYTVAYDENGYAKKAIHDNGASATSRPHTAHANDSATHQQMYQEAQKGNWDEVGRLSNNLITGPKTDYQTGDGTKANEYVGELQKEFGYNSHDYYKQKYEAIGGKGTWDDPDHHLPIVMPSQAPSAPSSANDGWNVVGQPNAAPGAPGGSGGGYSGGGFIAGGGPANIPSTGRYPIQPQIRDNTAWLREQAELQKEQIEKRIDMETNRAVEDLMRAQQDAQPGFQTQLNQIALDEAQARDRHAMYSEARGEKGGIGAAQYDAISNAAAMNRQAVAAAQMKLATDTNRQVADLRAKGEFQKADSLLQISQKLMEDVYNENIRVDEALNQWNMAVWELTMKQDAMDAEFTGMYRGQQTLQSKQLEQQLQDALRDDLAHAGWELLAMGAGGLTPDQLEAMGITPEQAQQYAAAVNRQLSAKASRGSGSGKGSGKDKGKDEKNPWGELFGEDGEAPANPAVGPNGESLLGHGPNPKPPHKALFQSVWDNANRMKAQGESDDRILDYLDTIPSTTLSDEDLIRIISGLNLNGYNDARK